MLNILYKDDAVIITIENATVREREVVELAEKVNQTVPNSVWSKFKNNQRKGVSVGMQNPQPQSEIESIVGSLDDFEEII